jgi:phage terminase large subunit-like protein
LIRDYADIAKDYAERVVKGRIPACGFVRMACERHLGELRRVREKEFAYRFDAARAAAVCKFIELMPHTKGKWARGGETIRLEDWQVFITANVFGWLRKDNGLRRYRKAYIEVPRKNGKSAWSAALANYMLAADGETGAEVYSGATTEKQAWEVFKPAKVMAERTEAFREAFGVEVMASNISIPGDGSKLEPLIGKPGDGASPSCAIVDEYHEHQTDDLYDTMETGMGAREQPLMWVITTAGSNIAGPCYALRSDVIRALDGTTPAPDLFGVIYTIDEGDDWTTEGALRKANPNYDVSVSGDFLKAQIRDAVQSARKQNTVKTKHLNVWVNARAGWMNMEAWNRQADANLSLDQFEGEPCWIGLDLASKRDIASKVMLFRRDDQYFLFGRHYLPETVVEEPDKYHYRGWVHGGALVTTEGDIIDHDRIAEDLAADAVRFQIQRVGYDPYNATQLAVNLEKAGIPTLEIRQTPAFLSDPMKWIEAYTIGGKLHHDGNPCMSWMVSNVTARVDANDNIFPRKERAESKIDGPVAAIIAMSVAQRAEEARKPEPRIRTL